MPEGRSLRIAEGQLDRLVERQVATGRRAASARRLRPRRGAPRSSRDGGASRRAVRRRGRPRSRPTTAQRGLRPHARRPLRRGFRCRRPGLRSRGCAAPARADIPRQLLGLVHAPSLERERGELERASRHSTTARRPPSTTRHSRYELVGTLGVPDIALERTLSADRLRETALMSRPADGSRGSRRTRAARLPPARARRTAWMPSRCRTDDSSRRTSAPMPSSKQLEARLVQRLGRRVLAARRPSSLPIRATSADASRSSSTSSSARARSAANQRIPSRGSSTTQNPSSAATSRSSTSMARPASSAQRQRGADVVLSPPTSDVVALPSRTEDAGFEVRSDRHREEMRRMTTPDPPRSVDELEPLRGRTRGSSPASSSGPSVKRRRLFSTSDCERVEVGVGDLLCCLERAAAGEDGETARRGAARRRWRSS